jgi:hypothetical protein
MKCDDQWLLTGAWVTMAAAGAFSIYMVHTTSHLDPTIERRATDLNEAQNRQGPKPLPGPIPRSSLPSRTDLRAGYFTPTEESTRFHPKFVGEGRPPRDRDILVLPFPVMEAAQADLDGVKVTWRTEQREVEHQPWMIPKATAPSGFMVMRESRLGEPEKIAELGPAARSFADLFIVPRQTYTYWVLVKGLETDRSNNDGNLVSVTNPTDRPVSANTPVATRLKLVGGDKTHAVLQVETYDRTKKAWVAKTALAAPGELVDGTGWSLKGLRFEKFTLVADLTDDDGVARVLSTRD